VYGTLAERPRRVQGMDIQLMTQTTAVSIDKARRLLGYAPRLDIREGMRRCEYWLRQDGYLPPTRRFAFAAATRGPQLAHDDTPDRAATGA
jgi:hypothetical protein